MSAVRQFRARESEAISPANPETLIAAPLAGPDDPLELLRVAIARLKCSNGDLADPTQVANLLTEAREALERANVIARAVKQCEEFLGETRFDKAFEALDTGLFVYPADPVLAQRRRQVEEQERAFHSAAAVRTALEEAKWLLDQGRPDLATQFLREKTAELPDQPALISRLEDLEALLPRWNQKRHVLAALERAATLEQLQQWPVALTILEEALSLYPASEELTGAARRVRDRLHDHDRQKKLARRLEQIRQKIALQSWREALALLDRAQKEFRGDAELTLLQREVDAGLRRSEYEGLIAEVRQCLADGELEQAEQLLRKGFDSLGQEPAFEALREELEAERTYREQLRTAQILFGRRQLMEAERVLAELVVPDRPEARALLDAVREARAVSEEENFRERGRDKALELMQQQQFAQAADVLRNLLSLFPGNPILERDLMTAESSLDKCAPATAKENPNPEMPAGPAEPPYAAPPGRQPGPPEATVVRKSSASPRRRAATTGAVLFVLAAAGGAAWKVSQSPPDARASAGPIASQAPGETPLTVTHEAVTPEAALPDPQPLVAAAPSSRGQIQRARSHATSLPRFVPPAAKRTPAQIQGPVLPQPPATVAIISGETNPGLPEGIMRPADVAAPPPGAPSQPAASSPTPASPSGGRIQEAQLIDRPLPGYPALARARGIFGIVRLEAVIDERGAVKDVRVVSGDPILALAAKNTVLTWKYRPAKLNGKAIATMVRVEVSFGDRNK
jgi:periplasmic protein TonB